MNRPHQFLIINLCVKGGIIAFIEFKQSILIFLNKNHVKCLIKRFK